MGSEQIERLPIGVGVLGWGSLIWDPRQLEVANWSEIDLRLPIEFSRISDDGRLTLVIDHRNGAPVPLLIARSRKASLDAAISNLAEREGCEVARIGMKRASDPVIPPTETTDQRVLARAQGSGFDAVIWTNLLPKFRDVLGVPFTIANAIRYLDSLRGAARDKAIEYIQRTPAPIQTPLRQELARLNWPRS